MPENFKLSQTEKILSILAFIVVSASIALALCIGLILPRHWTTEGYVNNKNDRSAEELSVKCGCGRKKWATKMINCIPRTLSDRILTQEKTAKSPEVCELVQDYPYLVSLNVAAYSDDSKERRLACSGTILSEYWILIGEDCVQNEDEFKALRVRAGSTYWSKGGTEYVLKSLSKFSGEGPTAVKLDKPLKFDKYVSAVKVPSNNIYTTWMSAASVGWRKGNDKKYDKFVVQKWTTTPCADHCYVGKVMGEPNCGEKTFGRSLVAENRLLVGLQTGICNTANRSEFMYVDLQTSDYHGWFKFLLGENVEGEEYNTTDLQSLRRELKGTTASPVRIYEVKECIVLDPGHSERKELDNQDIVIDESKTTLSTKMDTEETEEAYEDPDSEKETTQSTTPISTSDINPSLLPPTPSMFEGRRSELPINNAGEYGEDASDGDDEDDDNDDVFVTLQEGNVDISETESVISLTTDVPKMIII